MSTVILKPVISEKSLSRVEAGNVYTFKAPKNATKPQVAEVVEKTFGVKVISVNSKNYKSRAKRAGKLRRLVEKADAKQFTVKLDKKDKIGLFEIKKEGKKGKKHE